MVTKKEQIIQAYREGKTKKEITVLFNTYYGYVHSVIKLANLEEKLKEKENK